MKPYKPSNISPVNGTQLLLFSSILGAVISGGILSFVSQFFYLIILFPAVLGGCIGLSSSIGVNKGKVRNSLVAGAVAAIAAVVGYGSLNYGQYLSFKQSLTEEITKAGNLEGQTPDQIIDQILKVETGNTGFIGYMQNSAKQGLKITRSGRGNGIKLDQTFTLIYWLIELTIIEGIAVSMAVGAAREPFCEESQDWFGEEAYLARVELADQNQLIEALNADRYDVAATLLKIDEQMEPPLLDLTLRLSSSAIYDRFLTVKRTTVNNKGESSSVVILEGLISAKQQADLVENLSLINSEKSGEDTQDTPEAISEEEQPPIA
jgi:hypothetical protein